MKKYFQNHWRPLCVIVLLLLSFCAMLIGIRHSSLPAAILGLPCYVYILSALHECGHLIGCRLNGNLLTGFYVVFWGIREGRFVLLPQPKAESYCTFTRKERNALVFLCGPVLSLLVTFLVLFILCTAHSHVWILYFAVAGIHCLKNLIPVRNSDMQALLKEIKRKRQSL